MVDEYLGPVQHLVNLRPPVTPPTIGRRSSIRPMSRTSGVDFDQLPSPRPMSSAHKSGLNGRPGPSGLSRTGSYREPDPLSDSPNRNPDYSDEARDQSMFDDYRPQEDDSPGRLAGETSFSRIEQDDDDDDEEEGGGGEAVDPEETPKPSRRLEKGKGRATEELPEQDEDAEDEIATGLGGVDLEPESDASRDERPQKKSKKDPVKRDTATKNQRKKENKRMPCLIFVRFHAKVTVVKPGEKAQDGVNENRSNHLHIGEESVMSMGGRRRIQGPYSFPR